MFEIYHTLNRGVDKRPIFLDKQDYYRFVHDLYEFNNENSVESIHYKFSKSPDIVSRELSKERIPLVKIHAFIQMPNHLDKSMTLE